LRGKFTSKETNNSSEDSDLSEKSIRETEKTLKKKAKQFKDINTLDEDTIQYLKGRTRINELKTLKRKNENQTKRSNLNEIIFKRKNEMYLNHNPGIKTTRLS
jgi:hypothetical protein